MKINPAFLKLRHFEEVKTEGFHIETVYLSVIHTLSALQNISIRVWSDSDEWIKPDSMPCGASAKPQNMKERGRVVSKSIE